LPIAPGAVASASLVAPKGNIMVLRLLGVVCTAAIIAPGAYAETYANIESVLISDFTGRITVDIGGGGVAATITDGAKSFPVAITQSGGVLTIDGPDRPRRYRVHEEINWRRHKEEAFAIFLEDYPVLHLTMPAGTALEFDEAITIASVGDLEGDIIVDGGFVEAVIGDVVNANIGVNGAGDISVGAVRENLVARIGGSGDFEARSARTANLKIGGSGDLAIGNIAGGASMKIGGSGDIRADDVGGAVSASVAGSGDISIGDIAAGAEFAIAGSGDISADSVHGETSARISGSGDIEIAGGRAENLSISIRGSGDFAFDGVSTNLDASVRGSGSVTVGENEGSLSTSGRGEFRVGDITIDNDD